MARPLATGGGAVSTAPLVLLDLDTDAGITGRSYVFCYTPLLLEPLTALLRGLGERLHGEPLVPAALNRGLRAVFRLPGTPGLTMMALAGVDMAAWDAHAKASGLPLVRLLGGTARDLPAYNSNGLGIRTAARLGDEARELVDEGFEAIKLRLGYPDADTDAAAVDAVRAAVGAGVSLMVDYNQCLSVAEARRRVRRLDGMGLAWVEEPTRCDDYSGHARIRECAATPIQLGENCWGPEDVEKALAAGACDLLMPDAAKAGGVTGWLAASALASAAGVPVSSHLYPEVSAHLLCVAPTAHWLEFVDWASPVLARPMSVEGGSVRPGDSPGTGIEWNEEAVARYRVGVDG